MAHTKNQALTRKRPTSKEPMQPLEGIMSRRKKSGNHPAVHYIPLGSLVLTATFLIALTSRFEDSGPAGTTMPNAVAEQEVYKPLPEKEQGQSEPKLLDMVDESTQG